MTENVNGQSNFSAFFFVQWLDVDRSISYTADAYAMRSGVGKTNVLL